MKKELKKSLSTAVGDILKITYDANEEKIKSRLSDAQFRKVRKLASDPELFVKDVVAKKKEQARKYIPIKYDGNFNYTIVSAVYNVEKYLDEYFDSIVKQSLNFKKHIHIILVDDGSTDNSAEIIKKWQKKYPKNIHYHYKENGGQASARNLGLQYVETDWVTFIDPDDFVNADYFKNTDDVLTQNANVKMLVANTIFYMESKQHYKDGHPLRFRFHQKDKKFAIKDLGRNINLSVAASIFATKVIRDNELNFDAKVKPNFEDGKFIGEFLLHANDGEAWFSDDVIYYYRKRDDGSSTLDNAWFKSEKFSNVLEYGFIELLEKYRLKFGAVPTHIQMTALYDMYWYLVHLLNQSEKTDFLSAEQKQKYHQLYDEVMQFIDVKTIMDFNIGGAWFFHKVGFLGAFKGERPPFQVCYIEAIDKEKQQVLISHFDYFEEPASYLLDGVEVVPQYLKNVHNAFNDKLFVYEKRAWVAYEHSDQTLSIRIYGKPARLALRALAHKPSYKIADIEKEFTSPKYQSDGSWLLMDRETKADDNAEHLYRYLMNRHPEQVCYFALNRDSADWDRLSAEGFKLVEFGKSDFENRLAKADKIISSHIEAHIHNYFGDLYNGTKKFVFLQHGVTQNNLSRWLNGKRHLECFVTTTKDEYHSIVAGPKYKFSEKEVVLTGFPRHDELYRKNQQAQDNKTILIMPTWRSYLMGETVGKGANTRALNPKLLESSYATHWLSLLHSKQLKTLVDEYGYQVIFAPHANIEPYLPQMNLPSYLTIWSASQTIESMQDLFVRASMMITDYSSVAFEMAYIGKPTLYYQFDKDEFFSGKHSLQRGYFDYEQHGFGAVCYDEQSLLAELENVLANGIGATYQYRIDNTFAYQDDKNCERVYQAIKALDEPSDNAVNTTVLAQLVDSAYQYQNWTLLAERAKKLLEIEPNNQEVQLLFVQALTHTAQWGIAKTVLDEYELDAPKPEFLNAVARYDWQQAVAAYQKIDEPSFELGYQYVQTLIKLGQTDKAAKAIKALVVENETQQTAIHFIQADLLDDYEEVLILANELDGFDNQALSTYKLQLILSKACRNLGEYDLAHEQLVNFEKHTKNDSDCRLEIAKLAFARENYIKSVVQFELLLKTNYPLTALEQKQYLDAVFLAGQYDKYVEFFESDDVEPDHSGDEEVIEQEYKVKITADNQAFRAAHIEADWQTMIDTYQDDNANLDDKMLYIQALKKLNKTQEINAFIRSMDGDLTDNQKVLIDVMVLDVNQDHQGVIELTEQIGKLPLFYKKLFKPELLLARAYRKLSKYDAAHEQLVNFEKHTKNDSDCRLEIAKLAFARGQYGKCVNQLEKLQIVGYLLNDDEQQLYGQAVYLAGNFAKYSQWFESAELATIDDAQKVAYIKSLAKQNLWQAALDYAKEQKLSKNKELAYELTLATYRLGGIEEVYHSGAQLTADNSYEHWQLMTEIALLMEDKELEKRCYRGMIAIYPDRDKQANMKKLLDLQNVGK